MPVSSSRFPFAGGIQRETSAQSLSSSGYATSNSKWPVNAIWKNRSDTTDMWPSASSAWSHDNKPATRQASDGSVSGRVHETGQSLHDVANGPSASYLTAIGPASTYDASTRAKASVSAAEGSAGAFKYPSSLRDSVADDGTDANSASSPYASFGLLDTEALALRTTRASQEHSSSYTPASAAASVSSAFSASAVTPPAASGSNVQAGGAPGMPSYNSFGTLSQHGHAQRPSLQTSGSFTSSPTQPTPLPYHRNSQPEDANALELALRFRRKPSQDDRSSESASNALASNGYGGGSVGAYPHPHPQASSAAPFRFDPGSQPWHHGNINAGVFEHNAHYDHDQTEASVYAATRGGLGALDRRSTPLANNYRPESSPRNVAPALDPTDPLGRPFVDVKYCYPPLPHDPRFIYAVPGSGPNYIQQRQQYATATAAVAASYGNPLPHNLAAYSLYNNYRATVPVPAMGVPTPPLSGSFIPAPHLPMGRDRDPTQSLRSPLLDEFRSSRTNRKYELKDIYNHIVEFSGDQHGSRFIQSKLETANSDEKEHVFREISTNILVLMRDVFGNYVVQRFFEHGNQVQKKYLAEQMRGKMVDLSTQTYACRVVQKALQHILVDQQVALAKELESDVIRVIKDQNGNHVIQKVIELVPREYIGFIMDAFREQVRELSAHNFGCRVVQRMLEYGSKEDKAAILAELHASAEDLIVDQFGNYVIQHVIQFGDPEDRAKIIGKVTADLVLMSRHKFASNVVEKCIEYGSAADRRRICDELEAPAGNGNLVMDQLIKDQYGNYVIQRLLKELEREQRRHFATLLASRLDVLKDSTRQNGAIDRLNTLVVDLLKGSEDSDATVVRKPGVAGVTTGTRTSSPASSQAQVPLAGDNESTPSLVSAPDTPESSKPPSVGAFSAGEAVRITTTRDAAAAEVSSEPCARKHRDASQQTVALV